MPVPLVLRCRTGLAVVALAALPLGAAPATHAAETAVAVAANFIGAATEIAAAFEAHTGHRAVLSFASTGALFAQILQGAPFDVFLAADRERPRLAVDRGLAAPGSDFTYAVGGIVLFSADPNLVTGPETLRTGEFTWVALAAPEAAPYGAAAAEAMTALGVYDRLAPRFVVGTNISQAYRFVATGNAELGFVAQSQVIGLVGGSRWTVPRDLHTPIRQDGVLLATGAANEAAAAFVAFLRGPEATAILARYGYDTE